MRSSLHRLGKNDHITVGIKDGELAHSVESLVKGHLDPGAVLRDPLKKLVQACHLDVEAHAPGWPLCSRIILVEEDLNASRDKGNKDVRLPLRNRHSTLQSERLLVKSETGSYIVDHEVRCNFLKGHGFSQQPNYRMVYRSGTQWVARVSAKAASENNQGFSGLLI